MLSSSKLNSVCAERKMSLEQLAGHLAHGGMSTDDALRALKNWQKNLLKPAPKTEDVERLADGLGVAVGDISEWRASYRYAPSSPRKARLVTEMINGRSVQDALDVLKFEHKRAARMVEQVLSSAIANADEQEANVEELYVCEARVDGAGRRIGTKAWHPKDRGRAHPIRKQASHIHVAVAEI
ncbi:50S ribosomal protein L22 [Anaerohalosphaera lusitana]|uniref:Large ribosomal subunit protein uL22 n=1 Tax=Anaerohalosphaera lusitana TaxID=1936003 RepID=A0A1U9NQ53_9BACT|nr:50S ribosomal protein L22 [Anaerohalosphaera lusitana]AQT69848.1 50S ribosomal protein L22 [Anaerohalosphaera lusitana]